MFFLGCIATTLGTWLGVKVDSVADSDISPQAS